MLLGENALMVQAFSGSFDSAPFRVAWEKLRRRSAQDDRRQAAFLNAHFSNHQQSILTLKPL